MTSNVKLRAEICQLLLSAVGLRATWTEAGPDGTLANTSLTPQQRTMVGVATCLWDESVSVAISDVWNDLEPDQVTLIGTLLVASAYGDEVLADWLAINDSGRRPAAQNAVH